jgi:hypothetical protein
LTFGIKAHADQEVPLKPRPIRLRKNWQHPPYDAVASQYRAAVSGLTIQLPFSLMVGALPARAAFDAHLIGHEVMP